MKKSNLINLAQKRVQDFKKLQKVGLLPLDGNFFPSVHYPPITMYSSIKENTLFEGYTLPADELLDLYVHIPFCIRQCIFCHYPVKTGDLAKEKDYYLDMMKKEINIYMNRLGINIIKVRSILIGGGTPTYLSPSQLKRFLQYFTSKLDMSSLTQFSYDVDPTTLIDKEGKDRLKIMKDYGVDRLTIGIQSLHNNILKNMNRAHTVEEALRSIDESKKAGFKINIEFIYGYPNQTIQSWIDTIKKAVSLGTEEIQLYRLKIVPYGDHKGIILKKFKKSPDKILSPEKAIMLKQIAISLLSQNGYNENLRRVFTKKRKDYSHYADNQCCKLKDQIGFGLTAFSSLRDRFGLNTQDFNEYYSYIEKGKLPVNRGLVRTKDDQLRWHIILPLKNREVYKKVYKKQTGVSLNNIFRKKIENLKEFDLLYENEKVLRLTELGKFFADEVCQQFHHPNYIPFPKEAYVHGKLYPYDDC